MKKSDRQTGIIVTVDTETYPINGALPPFDLNIYGRLGGSEYGVNRIMDICEKYDMRGTFFVDVYMHHHYGEEPVRSLCRTIGRRGHDVQLHAHANWIPNHPHEFVSRYPLSEQIEIIAEGKRLIGDWTGTAPAAFRAGAYGLNLDTIKALEVNGFKADASYFPHHRNCELSGQLNNKHGNKIFTIGSVHELPVTTYWLLDTPFYRKNSKLDFNACTIGELKDVLPKFIKSNIKFVVLFLHSFSFLKWGKGYSHVDPDLRALRSFEETLEFLKEFDSVNFLTVKEAIPLFDSLGKNEEDFIPRVDLVNVFPRIVKRLQ